MAQKVSSHGLHSRDCELLLPPVLFLTVDVGREVKSCSCCSFSLTKVVVAVVVVVVVVVTLGDRYNVFFPNLFKPFCFFLPAEVANVSPAAFTNARGKKTAFPPSNVAHSLGAEEKEASDAEKALVEQFFLSLLPGDP